MFNRQSFSHMAFFVAQGSEIAWYFMFALYRNGCAMKSLFYAPLVPVVDFFRAIPQCELQKELSRNDREQTFHFIDLLSTTATFVEIQLKMN